MRGARLAAALAVAGTAMAVPAAAAAHGLGQRADLPVPSWLFAWGAALVLMASFVALAVLWPTPRLETEGWRPLPQRVSRVLANPLVDLLCGAAGIGLLGVVVWSGFAGSQVAAANFAPTFVYVVFWVGLVPASVLFGDVFRAFNPWRAIGRAAAGIAAAAWRRPLPPPVAYPLWLGRWPAVAGLAGFTWLELCYQNPGDPRVVAAATVAYTAVTLIAMSVFGVNVWIERGEAFSVYFNLFSRLAVWERRGRSIGARKPLSGLPGLALLPGTVALLAVMLGSVTFDGGAEGPAGTEVLPRLQDGFTGLGLSPSTGLTLALTVGLAACVLLIGGFYWLGITGVHSAGGDLSTLQLARSFAHTLVPIALVYAFAHYCSSLLYQGQAIAFLASDPLGRGWDVFGTAEAAIDYTILGATAIWYVQVGALVLGHVAGLTLAHDRALVLYRRAHLAVRSQYWMLAVMIGFTALGLWLLSQANA